MIETRGRKTKIKPQNLDFLKNFLENKKNGITSLEFIRKELMEKFKLSDREFSLYLVRKMLKKLEYSRKRTRVGIVRKNSLKNVGLREKLAKKLLTAISKKKLIIFVDETGFNSTIVPTHGYSRKG